MSDLILPVHIRRYKARQMVSEVQRLGLEANEALLYNWAERGLIGKPKGGRWNQPQLGLWIRLLIAKQHENVPVSHLFNIPIAGWLLFGDEQSGVELAQVQRAMDNWVKLHKRSNIEKLRGEMQRTVNLVKTSQSLLVASAKQKLNMIFQKAGDHDYTEVRHQLSLIFGDTPQKIHAVGPSGVALTVDNISGTWELREKMILHYDEIDLTQPWQWEWARAIMVTQIGPYNQNSPDYAHQVRNKHPDLKSLYAPMSINDSVSLACIELLTLIGLGREAVETGQYYPEIQPQLQPLAWKEGRFHGKMTFRVIFSPLEQNFQYEGEYTIEESK